MQQTSSLTTTDNYIPIIGIDIGGTNSKVSIAVKKGSQFPIDHIESLTITTFNEFNIYFFILPSREIASLTTLIKSIGIHKILTKVHITGGGAYKYQEEIENDLNLEIVTVEEFSSHRLGFYFLEKILPNESFFTYSEELGNTFIKSDDSIFPLLYVAIGTSVSLLRFEENNRFQRLGGTCLGGGMFLGLCNATTGIRDYQQILEMSKLGSANINGGTENADQNNVVKSIYQLIAHNLSQLSFLWAKKLNLTRIFFSGNFISCHLDTIQFITKSVQEFSKVDGKDRQAYFVQHDGFVGSLAALSQSFQDYNRK